MKKLFLFFVFFASLNSIILAKEIHLNQAKEIAKNIYYGKINQIEAFAFDEIDIRDSFTISSDSKPVFHVFNIGDNKGFVIISAEDNVSPLLAYSLKNRCDERNQPPAFIEMRENFEKQINYVRKNALAANDKIRTDWAIYQRQIKSEQSSTGVEALITSTWDQDLYYNAFCPEDPAGVDGHARVGCVATAMAQVMRYHKYPESGTGSHSYYRPIYGTISADFGSATYNWNEMGNFLTDYNDEVAEICFHCGVGVEMMYGPEGSGAYSSRVPSAFINFFNYSPTTHIEYRSNYSSTGWKDLLKNELDHLRPMYVSGHGSGGHAFVCDGYDSEDFFHFNWGWGGLYNGYYLITNLHPGTHDYSQGQAAIVGMQSPLPPTADFNANTTVVINSGSVNFYDNSTGVPYSWQWEFEGGDPGSSDLKNPANITYHNPGIYQVSLTVTNANGSNSVTKTNYIFVSESALPIADFTVNDTIPATGATVVFSDLSLNAPTSWVWEFEPATVTLVNETNVNSQNPEVQFHDPVSYTVTLTATNSNGEDSVTKTDFIYSGGLPIPYLENFEQGSFKERWIIENPDGGITWDGYYKVSGNLPSRRAAWMNFYAYESIGERDRLMSPMFNFSYQEGIMLSFKHAYAIYNSVRKDSLIIKLSTDNGASWTRIFQAGENGSGNFATHQPLQQEFVPRSPEDWCGVGYGSYPITIDLTPWAGSENVRIMFESYNGHGNSLYIDDFEIDISQPPFVCAPIPDTSFAEDSSPRTIVTDLNTVFSHADTSETLTFSAASDNEKIQPVIYDDNLMISFYRNYFGTGNIIVTAFDHNWSSVSDSFLVNIKPINDAPTLTLPDSLIIQTDSTIVLDIWHYARDLESPDSLLNYEFNSDNDNLILDFSENSGELTLSAPNYSCDCCLYISATDDSNATVSDSINIRVTNTTDIETISQIIPTKYELFQNYPNPFNAETLISYQLPKHSKVEIKILNISGQEIKTLFHENKPAGLHRATWDGTNNNGTSASSGVYIINFVADNFKASMKVILLK